MQTLKHACRAALGFALALPCTADDTWRIAAADARIPLSVDGDLYTRPKPVLETVIDFNTVLGANRVLAADSVVLLRAGTDERLGLDLAQDAEIRYASGNPILRLRWKPAGLTAFANRGWHLYFRTVEPGNAGAWTPLEATFLPTLPDLLFKTSFEKADSTYPDRPEFMNPGGKDKEGETTDRVWTEAEAHTGQHALKIARRRDGEAVRNSNRPFWWTWPPPIPVVPGQTLQISAWLKAPQLEPRSQASVMLEFRDAERRRLAEGRLRLTGARLPHDWMRVRGSATAPADAAMANIWFGLHGLGEAYCDDIDVTTLPGGVVPSLPVTVGAVEDRAAFTAARDARPEGKVFACSAAGAPPVLDGALDDACWQNAGRITDFEIHTRVPGTDVKTTVYACADREALYFGFECTEPETAELLAAAGERDGPVWQDDSVELFLDTNLDLHTYYQIIVNPRGTIFDQDKGAAGVAGPKWNGPVTAAARILPDRWTAEVRLEFTGLRLAEAEGRVWGANFARSSFRGGRSLYTWAPIRRNFGEPQYFGQLVLPFDPTANVVTGKPLAEGRVFCGPGTLPFEVRNCRDRAVEVRLSATDTAADGERLLGTVAGVIPPQARRELRIPASFPTSHEVRVRYDLTEADTGRLLYRTSVVHVVAEPLSIEPGTLVSYVEENHLRGHWTIGLARAAFGTARLVLAVHTPGAEKPVVSSEFVPNGTTGAYAIDVSGAPAGRHEVRIRLMRDGEEPGANRYWFDRIPGPFAPGR